MGNPNGSFVPGSGFSEPSPEIQEIDAFAPPMASSEGGVPSYWKWIAIAEAAILLIGLVIGGLALSLPGLLSGDPVAVVEAFYTHLDDQEFEAAASLIDPHDSVSITALPSIMDLVQQAESKLGQTDLQVILAWDFQEMQYTLLSREKSEAQVKAYGKIRIFEINSNLGVTFTYNGKHDLIRIKNQWYLDYEP